MVNRCIKNHQKAPGSPRPTVGEIDNIYVYFISKFSSKAPLSRNAPLSTLEVYNRKNLTRKGKKK
jgi:hypothetical protein